jgi:hypothetical protein
MAVEQRRAPITEEEITREEFPELEPPVRQHGRERVRRVLGAAGSILLVVAPFATLASNPGLGRIVLFQQARVDALVLLVAALLALATALSGRFGLLWVSGAVGVFEMGRLSYFFYRHWPAVIGDLLPQAKAGLLGFLGKFLWANVTPDWGAMVLALGTIVSLGVAISAGFENRRLAPAAKLGIWLLVLAVAYLLLAFFFPVGRFAPPPGWG